MEKNAYSAPLEAAVRPTYGQLEVRLERAKETIEEQRLGLLQLRQRLHGATENVGRFREEAEQLRKDAERYRWLVANSFDCEGVPQLHVWLHSWEPHSQTGEPTEWKQRVRGPAIDRAIDAAMGAGT